MAELLAIVAFFLFFRFLGVMLEVLAPTVSLQRARKSSLSRDVRFRTSEVLFEMLAGIGKLILKHRLHHSKINNGTIMDLANCMYSIFSLADLRDSSHPPSQQAARLKGT